MSPPPLQGQGVRGSKADKACCISLGFRVPTTSMGTRVQRGAKGVKGSKVYSILGFRVPTTSVGAWGEGAKGSKGGQRGAKGVKGSEGGRRERRGAKVGQRGVKRILY